MLSTHETLVAYMISSGILTYILKAILGSLYDARSQFHKFRHIAGCINREILMNTLNIGDFIATIPIMESKLNNDSKYKPFMVSNNKSADIVNSLREDMLKLPGDVVDSIVEFYYYDHEINVVMEKMQTQDFSDLSTQRKAEVMENLKIVLKSTKDSGDYALLQLEEFLKETERGFATNALKKFFKDLNNIFVSLKRLVPRIV